MAAAIAVDLFLVASDYITILWGNVPRERAALDMILPGGSWQALFWLEWVVGGLVPFVLLVVPRLRRRLGLLALASVLVMVGVYAFRIELVVGGMLRPLIHLAPGNALGSYQLGQSVFQFDGVYHPTWVEYGIVTGLVAFLALLIMLGYRWLRPVERDGAARERRHDRRPRGRPRAGRAAARLLVEPPDSGGARTLGAGVGAGA